MVTSREKVPEAVIMCVEYLLEDTVNETYQYLPIFASVVCLSSVPCYSLRFQG